MGQSDDRFSTRGTQSHKLQRDTNSVGTMGVTRTRKESVSDPQKDQLTRKRHGNIETRREGIDMIDLLVFACGEGEEVVLGEHIGQTAVVCYQSRGDATETSDLDNVFFLVHEACIINVSGLPHKSTATRNTHQ